MTELRRRMLAGEELVGTFLDLGSALAAEITAGAAGVLEVPAIRVGDRIFHGDPELEAAAAVLA